MFLYSLSFFIYYLHQEIFLCFVLKIPLFLALVEGRTVVSSVNDPLLCIPARAWERRLSPHHLRDSDFAGEGRGPSTSGLSTVSENYSGDLPPGYVGADLQPAQLGLV